VKILLFGRNGQVGWELQRALAPLGELHALRQRRAPTSPIRSRSPRRCARSGPTWSSTPRRYTAVDRAEAEPAVARRINAEAPAVLARETAAAGAWLVHYSTDYVFDGSGDTPRGEDAPTGPLNVYGQTKLEGEQAIRASGGRHLVLRTSWVYGTRGGNFARTMLRLAQERDRLR
jgi:dTDP-4-dehydrorhamnose reductase